jgi:phosphate starvation-inducible PhoH-like protein
VNTHDVVFCIGRLWNRQDVLAVAHALKEILNKERKKLILTRPVVEAGESLGFLPGDLAQKVSPYLRPLYDAMDDMIPVDLINRFEEHRTIEIAPLAYMRGRSLRNSYIILDEAQNTTREQMKMFLTRLGEGSKAVITGDVTQIDLPKKNQSGLLHCMKILTDIPEIYFSFLDTRDVVRNAIVKKIINAYENEQPE